MFDAALEFQFFLPAAGATVTVSAMDLSATIRPFSDNWRAGRLRITWPALPNHTDPAKVIVITFLDSADGGVTFEAGGVGAAVLLPRVEVRIPGVAGTGATANFSDISLPPGLRGPIGLAVAVPADDGDNTAALITAGWGSN